MGTVDTIREPLKALVGGRATPEQQQTVFSAFASGDVTLAGGVGSVSIGGDAPGAQVLTGDGSVALNLSIGEVEVLREAMRLLYPERLRQLPGEFEDFTGRQEEISILLDRLSGGGGAAAISALDGLGGIGKSALAVQVAHRLILRYPAGQLFQELGGTSETPATVEEIMGRVIHSFTPMAQLPEDPEELAAVYRNLLAGQPVLLVLDNARDATQVQPLLPPAPSAAIITSRRPIALANVASLPLGTLPFEESRTLLREIVGGDRATDRDLNRITKACGNLPLALRVAGTFLKVYRNWSVAEYLAELEDEHRRLRALKVPDHDLDVAATLALSVSQLSRKDAALALRWRQLSVFADSFERGAVASVWDCEETAARDGLSELLRHSMVFYDQEDGGYQLHGLMRDMGRQGVGVADADTDVVREALYQAVVRHAVHYCNVLAAARNLFLKGGDDILAGLTLFDRERRNIEAGQVWAAAGIQEGGDRARLCSRYSDAGAYILSLRRHPRQTITWFERAVEAACQLRDRQGESTALGNLGNAYQALGEYRRALKYYEQILEMAREIGGHWNEGSTLGNMGNVYEALGEYRRAIEHHKQALAIFHEIEDRRSVGEVLGNLGNAYRALGEDRRSIEHHEQYLEIAREIGDRRGEGNALGSLGNTYQGLGEDRRALKHFVQALAIFREIGDRQGEGSSLGNLGIGYQALGEYRRTIEHQKQALAILREIGDRRGEGSSLGNLGTAYQALGEFRRAIEYHAQHLEIAREIGDRKAEGNALFNSASSLKEIGEHEEAVSRATGALEIFEEINSPDAEVARQALRKWGQQKKE